MTTANALKYPGDLTEKNSDYVLFEFYEYAPPYKDTTNSDQTTNYTFEYNYNLTNQLKQASNYLPIILYMPEDISASYQIGRAHV